MRESLRDQLARLPHAPDKGGGNAAPEPSSRADFENQAQERKSRLDRSGQESVAYILNEFDTVNNGAKPAAEVALELAETLKADEREAFLDDLILKGKILPTDVGRDALPLTALPPESVASSAPVEEPATPEAVPVTTTAPVETASEESKDVRGLEQELANVFRQDTDDVAQETIVSEGEPQQIYDWKSPAEIEAALGPAMGDLRGFPFWDLADDSAIIMRKGDEGALRVGKNGVIKIPGRASRNESTAWFQYDGDRFGEITNERYEQIIAEMVRANEEHRVQAVERTRTNERKVRAERGAEERATRVPERSGRAENAERISVNDAYVRFLEERTENVKRGVAFENSARNLSPVDRAMLADVLEKKGKIDRAMLDAKLADLLREDERTGRQWEVAAAGPRAATNRNMETFATSEEAVKEFEERTSRNEHPNTAYREATKRLSLFGLNNTIARLRLMPNIDQAELERVIARDGRLAAAPTERPEIPLDAEPAERPPREEAPRENREARERRELLRAIDEDLAKIRVRQ